VENFLTSWKSVHFSGRTLLYGVSEWESEWVIERASERAWRGTVIRLLHSVAIRAFITETWLCISFSLHNVNAIHWTILWTDLLGTNFGTNWQNLLVMKFGSQWKYEKYVKVQTEVSVIVMYLLNYTCVYNLLVPTDIHIILLCILYNVYFFTFLLPTCFSWSPTSASLQPNGL
jgi:hypothetical protein